MADRLFNLAIETSSPRGSVTLGEGDRLIETMPLPPQRRHTVDLMPVIDALCKARAVRPAELREVYVSVGPGSFTGLRISIATVKALALSLGLRVFAVPTLDALALHAPDPTQSPQANPAALPALAVVMNLKGDNVYSSLFAWSGDAWRATHAPALRTMGELLAAAPRGRALWLLGDPVPPMPDSASQVVRLAPELATPRSEAVWRLGRGMASRGATPTDPATLVPLYIRPVEAEVLWEKRQTADAEKSTPRP